MPDEDVPPVITGCTPDSNWCRIGAAAEQLSLFAAEFVNIRSLPKPLVWAGHNAVFSILQLFPENARIISECADVFMLQAQVVVFPPLGHDAAVQQKLLGLLPWADRSAADAGAIVCRRLLGGLPHWLLGRLLRGLLRVEILRSQDWDLAGSGRSTKRLHLKRLLGVSLQQGCGIEVLSTHQWIEFGRSLRLQSKSRGGEDHMKERHDAPLP